MVKKPKLCYTGTVRLHAQENECEFDLDKNFASLSEEDKVEVLIRCMWESGLVSINYKEKGIKHYAPKETYHDKA